MKLTEKNHTALGGCESRAVFSPCEKYRYWLSRRWQEGGRSLAFIMLNPSTADELENDATIERCERRARHNGYGGLVVCNLFAWRATDPSELKVVPDPVGPDNDAVIGDLFETMRGSPHQIICGWGPPGTLKGRDRQMMPLFEKYGLSPMALRITKGGCPQHPLYLPYSLQPSPFSLPDLTKYLTT